MLLAIDVGNTNIVIGVFEGEALGRSWRLATACERTGDELGLMFVDLLERAGVRIPAIDGVVMASVVPQLTGPMADMANRYLGLTPLIVEADTDIGLANLYAHPSEVGADRLVNAVAAWAAFGRERGQPLIVVDFGTATTFDAISARGEYLGGVICPGIQISADALFQRAAKLPRIDVQKPSTVIGRTTVASMQAGLFFGYVEMTQGLVRRIRAELGGAAFCVATGGLAEVIAPETDVIDAVDGDLTLRGLKMVWDRRTR
ncbi:MAG TPA: type III pantothenate kinase [Vicinamibacterales bacterium]|nr:type III pantothenate kinase [Vicinamibacterales bacterium]HPW21939.1 type III pantothenate kinase [Vicinamibacterales bacterium]